MSPAPAELLLSPVEQRIIRALGICGLARTTARLTIATDLANRTVANTLRTLRERGIVDRAGHDHGAPLHALTHHGRGLADQLGATVELPPDHTPLELVLNAARDCERRLRREWPANTNARARANLHADQLADAIDTLLFRKAA